jgi:hypothetical protein
MEEGGQAAEVIYIKARRQMNGLVVVWAHPIATNRSSISVGFWNILCIYVYLLL